MTTSLVTKPRFGTYKTPPKEKAQLMTLEQFKEKYNLTDIEFEDYIERTGIMHYDGGIPLKKAHDIVLKQLLERRKTDAESSKYKRSR